MEQFKMNHIDGRILLSLNEENIKNDFGIVSIGHRKHLEKNIEYLKKIFIDQNGKRLSLIRKQLSSILNKSFVGRPSRNFNRYIERNKIKSVCNVIAEDEETIEQNLKSLPGEKNSLENFLESDKNTRKRSKTAEPPVISNFLLNENNNEEKMNFEKNEDKRFLFEKNEDRRIFEKNEEKRTTDNENEKNGSKVGKSIETLEEKTSSKKGGAEELQVFKTHCKRFNFFYF